MSDAKDNHDATNESLPREEDEAQRPQRAASEEEREERAEEVRSAEEASLTEPASDDLAQGSEPGEAPEPELTAEEMLEQSRREAQQNYDSYLRAVADLDTYRRRVAREKEELRTYAVSELLEKLLPVYDNLCLGMESAEQTNDPKVVVQGLQMVLTQFRAALEEHGASEISPEPGEAFDPNRHEAFQSQPSDEIEEGRVVRRLRKGFMLNGRLARPASVVVSDGPASPDEARGENADTSKGDDD